MNVIDITLDNAQQYVIDESFKRPVLVDFWADWCGPCKTLMPLLEKLADEYSGEFLLARINADEQQMLASQFQVRSLPTVMLIKDGQPLDGFTGAQSEVQVRQMLEQHLPKAWERDLQQAQAMLEAGQYGEAVPVLQRVYEESGRNPQIACMGAQAQVELNRLEEAETTLSNVKLADQDTLYEQVKAKIELKKQAAKTPEIESLEQALEADPDNPSYLDSLGWAFFRRGELDLLEVVQPSAQRGDLVLEPLDVFDGRARLQSLGIARDALLDEVDVGLHATQLGAGIVEVAARIDERRAH